MAFQNRVDPYGRLHAVSDRGGWVGNRGVLINDRREVVRPFRLQRWITCSLQFKNRHRVVFTPRRWTELFFLDEVTAFAAGHRPCAECRRERYNAFRAAWPWTGSSPQRAGGRILAEDMDSVLQVERVGAKDEKVTYQSVLGDLPDGSFVDLDGQPALVFRSRLWSWSFSGYQPLRHRDTELSDRTVDVLTPKSTVGVLTNGYVPQIHSSASMSLR